MRSSAVRFWCSTGWLIGTYIAVDRITLGSVLDLNPVQGYIGYLHLDRTFSMSSSSFCSSCGIEQTALAMWFSGLTTLYFAEMVWWLSQCRYFSVWVRFLGTVVARLPLGWGMTKVSTKAMEPSPLVSSAVNCMLSLKELICSRNPLLCAVVVVTKVLSTYLLHRCWGWGDVLRAFTSEFFILQVGYYGVIGVCPGMEICTL